MPLVSTAVMQAPSVPIFPSEIIDFIIDHLYQDRPALNKCSLVSKSWLPRSRFHLLRHSCYRITLSKVQAPNHGLISAPSPLSALVSHPLATFPPYIRTLSIKLTTGRIDLLVPSTRSPIIHLPGMKHLTSVHCLILCGVNPYHAITWIPLLSQLDTRRITALDFRVIQFSTLADIIKTIALFPALEILSYSCPPPDIDPTSSVIPHTAFDELPPRNLRQLNWRRRALYAPLFDWLATGSISRPSKLYLSGTATKGPIVDSINNYLRSIGSELEDLTVTLQVKFEEVNHDSLLQRLDLANNSGIVSLELIILYSDPSPRFGENWIIGILEKIAGSGLQTLSLRWTPRVFFASRRFETDIVSVDWSALDSLLSGSAFPALQKLFFRQARSNSTKVYPLTTIREKFPSCLSRGIIGLSEEA